ncbi:MAG TPA: T9SS type A sorting domain-containing protein [Ignavibacteriaceae bacterium]|nr:T9SS type A sorting domain-containing protein [Ignavibacteriaceae bacterium]
MDNIYKDMYYFQIDNENNFYYSSYESVYCSKDSGRSWNKIAPYRAISLAFLDSTILLVDYNKLYMRTPSYNPDLSGNFNLMLKGSKRQFFTSGKGQDISFDYFSLNQRNIDRDTIIDNKKYYYQNSEGPLRYDQDSNKTFININGTDYVYLNFNLFDGDSFTKYYPNGSTANITITRGITNLFGKDRKYVSFKEKETNWTHYEYYAQDFGLYRTQSSSGSIGGPSSSSNSYFISGLIPDSTENLIYLSKTGPPSLNFQSFITTKDSIINLPVNAYHLYNRQNYTFGTYKDGVVYIDTVQLIKFYKKDSIVIESDTLYGLRTINTFDYKFNIPVDLDLLRNGYGLNYKLCVRDKQIIPETRCYPDTGYYICNYDNTTRVKENKIVTDFSLEQNYPNPFNPSTTIKYTLPKQGLVTIKIYDVLGKEIAQLVNEEKQSGEYEVEFNGSSLSSGIYYYKIQAGEFVQTKKMVLMK